MSLRSHLFSGPSIRLSRQVAGEHTRMESDRRSRMSQSVRRSWTQVTAAKHIGLFRRRLNRSDSELGCHREYPHAPVLREYLIERDSKSYEFLTLPTENQQISYWNAILTLPHLS